MGTVKAKAQLTIFHIIDIKAMYRYYLLQSSTLSKPSKPTTYPPSSTWASTEPTYTSGSTNSLYFVDCTVFSDNTFEYTDVSLSSSYEAAKAAYNKAVAVDSRVADAETQIEQNTTDIALRATKTELTSLMEGNLIVNGFGLNKNNYNFNQWLYDGTDKCDGFPSFKYTGTPRDLFIPYYMIPIDISKTYEFSMYLKATSNKIYLGWDEFDIDGKQINATYCMGYSASTTTLASDLKDGDTVVYLTSASGWTTSTATHQLGLIFWNYKDSTGYQYPEGVYSRNAWTNLYTSSNVNKTNNTITLNSAWNHGTFPAGTKVSQSNSSGHKYFNYTNAAPPSNWTETTYTISGDQELYKFTSNKFNQAAKYARFIILHNYSGGSTSATTNISKVSFADVTLKKNLTDNYYTKTQTDAKIKVEADKITSAVSRISANETAISTLEQTADGLTARLDTTDSNVSTAQSTANTAKTNAATAQSTANTARTEAANAAKTATNYLSFSSSGLVVGDMTSSTLGRNVLIDSDSVDIRNGSTVLASFGETLIELGKNSSESVISFCGDNATMTATKEDGSGYYDGIKIEATNFRAYGENVYLNSTMRGNDSNYNRIMSTTRTSDNTIGNDIDTLMKYDGQQYNSYLTTHSSADSTSQETWASMRSNHYTGSAWERNWLKVTPTVTTLSDMSNSGVIRPWQKTLWSGSYYMTDTQTATLSEAISDQPNGIILLWSYYLDGASENSNFSTYFIPKHFITLHNGRGISIFISNSSASIVATKYIYVSDTQLTGHSNNNAAASSKSSGVTTSPRYFVLRYVIGV